MQASSSRVVGRKIANLTAPIQTVLVLASHASLNHTLCLRAFLLLFFPYLRTCTQRLHVQADWQWKGNGKFFWHILYINANTQCEVILFVCASVCVCVCVCVCVRVLIYGRRQKKFPCSLRTTGAHLKKKAIERVIHGTDRFVRIPVSF